MGVGSARKNNEDALGRLKRKGERDWENASPFQGPREGIRFIERRRVFQADAPQGKAYSQVSTSSSGRKRTRIPRGAKKHMSSEGQMRNSGRTPALSKEGG